ncbi:MAG: hypothetical protein P8181_10290 [bacterium]
MRLLAILTVLSLMALPVMADPPAQGTYLSDDFPGGTMLTGYFSEAWVGAGRDGQIGNTINAESWDGNLLGTQWMLWCPSIQTSPTLVSDTRDANGTGEVTYRTTYQGGYFWLSGNGPWGNGTQDYSGDLAFFNVVTTYQFVFGNLLGIRSNVTTSGLIDGFTDCMEYEINNAAFFGNTDDTGPKPAEFPAFLDENCNEGVLTRGGWGSVTEIALRILGDCDVATQPSTWGKIKSLYSE